MGLHGGTQAERTLIRIGRTLLAGTLLTALTSVIVASAELIAQTIQIGMMQLPPVVIALLFLLVLFNRGLARLRREWAFTTPELAVLFVMMLFGAMLASRGLMERLIPTQVGVSYYAEGNRWETLYFPHIRPEIVPWDPQQPQPEPLVKHFYQRLPYGQSIPWGSWIASTAHLSLIHI